MLRFYRRNGFICLLFLVLHVRHRTQVVLEFLLEIVVVHCSFLELGLQQLILFFEGSDLGIKLGSPLLKLANTKIQMTQKECLGKVVRRFIPETRLVMSDGEVKVTSC